MFRVPELVPSGTLKYRGRTLLACSLQGSEAKIEHPVGADEEDDEVKAMQLEGADYRVPRWVLWVPEAVRGRLHHIGECVVNWKRLRGR